MNFLSRLLSVRVSGGTVRPALTLIAIFAFSVPALGQSELLDEQQSVGVGIEKAFARLRFERPVYLTHASDGSNRVFVVEQKGVIRVFPNLEDISTSEVFLDISDRVSRLGNEEGLLGLAFHPDYRTNGRFFVHYSSSVQDMMSTVSSFQVSADDPNVADPDSEQIILQEKQPYRNHNGGMIAFGPDKFLYCSLGDGGFRDDPHGNGQNLATVLGSILRIDVNQTNQDRQYGIPADNPFSDESKQAEQSPAAVKNARPEIWAYGLRNVWRFSFDRTTGELWAGDVGQGEFEDVNLIRRGGNYGWNRFEADSLFNESTELVGSEHIPPIASYSHSWGLSITGGYVYRGQRFPELNGAYLYADYVSGNLWALRKDSAGKYVSQLVRRTGRSVASFGEDEQGEVYLCSFDGSIYRVIPSSEQENTFDDWPKKLSESGYFASLKKQTVCSDFHRYEVNAAFWSDNALKHRYFSVPEGQQLGYRDDGTWEMPVGTKIIKHFQRRDRKPIETRLIVRTDSGWEAATYIWNRDHSDAELTPEGKQFEIRQPLPGQKKATPVTWHSPSSSECASCHTDAAGYVLGMNTAQLNRSQIGQSENQIHQWIDAGLVDIDSFEPADAAKFCSPFDPSADVATRARVLLEVNCAMCHRPNGPGNANIDLRFATATENMNVIGVKPAQAGMGVADGKLIAPGSPDRSLLAHHMKTLGQGRMPPIGSNVVDVEGVRLIEEWIQTMDRAGD